MSAMILGRAPLPIDPLSISSVAEAALKAPPGAVDSFEDEDAVLAFGHFFEPFAHLSSRFVSTASYGLHSCAWVGPHEDATIGDLTIGLVLHGSHYLFVDDGVKVGDLLPGTLYALNNKTLHGAFCREGQETPLVFLTLDLVCDWDDAKASLMSLAAEATRAVDLAETSPA